MRVVTKARTTAAAACAVVVVAVTDGAGSAETLVERGALAMPTPFVFTSALITCSRDPLVRWLARANLTRIGAAIASPKRLICP